MTTLDLPAGCQWSDTVDDAVTALDAGRIPLLRPDDTDRARRWAQVMRWYAPLGHTPMTELAGAVVVSVGPVETIGHLAATALSRPHHHVTTSAAAAELPASRSVLLVATGPDCALDALTPALDMWTHLHTQVGLLTGRDTAGIVFSLAKILASRTSARAAPEANGNNALLDGPAGRARRLPHTNERLRFADVLTNDWLTVLVNAHGSGAHAWLGPYVLCGLTGTEERTGPGHVIPNGCTSSRCKLSPDGTLSPLHPHQLRTVFLGLFVCNAIAVGPNEQYPSDVSLAVDALEGHPAAVLGLIRGDADTNALEPAVSAHLLHAGTSFGEIVRLLTHAVAHRRIPHAAIVLGDPEQALPATANAYTPAIALPQDPPLALPVITSGGRPLPALITPGRALLAAPDAAARVEDVHTDAHSMLAQLSTWTSRLTEAHLVDDVLRATSTKRPHLTVEACLDVMGAARSEATRLVLSTIRSIQRLRAHRVAGLPADPRHDLDQLAGRWAQAVTKLAIDSPSAVFSHLTEAVTAHHHFAHETTASPCGRCGAPRQRRYHSSPLPIENRTDICCPRCGLSTSRPDTGTELTLRTPQCLHPGHPLALSATLNAGQPVHGVLAVQLRSRSASQHSYASHTCPASSGSVVTVMLDIPDDAEAELHRVWALFAHNFQLTFALHRIPALPHQDD